MTLDLLNAVRALLRDDSTVLGILGESEQSPGGREPSTTVPAKDRIYRNRLPRSIIKAASTFHPPKMIVLRQAGGFGKADELPTVDERIQVLCYGESDYEANRLRRAVYGLFYRLERKCYESVLIHHITPAGGPVPLVDPDIVWSAVSQSFNLKADIEEAA